ncbi:MAG: hypothetical protein FJ125_03650 [Deltaproteobacteria bacterium]|nr:hypothetical protein [Deltaproteobacteria bacterium]
MLQDAGWARRADAWTAVFLLLGSTALPGCTSTALSLDDPNAINATFDPEFIEDGIYEAEVQVRFVGVEDSADGPSAARAVGDWNFGDGLFLSAWEFQSDFSLTIGIKRFADAPKGRRTLSLEIYNGRGTFLARGAFTVL